MESIHSSEDEICIKKTMCLEEVLQKQTAKTANCF